MPQAPDNGALPLKVGQQALVLALVVVEGGVVVVVVVVAVGVEGGGGGEGGELGGLFVCVEAGV